MSSPASGKYQARFHSPTSSNARARGDRKVVGRRDPDRIKQLVAVLAGKRTERHRRIGRSKGRRSDLGHRPVQRAGHDPEGIEVRRFALVGGHTGRRIALDVLDGLEALGQRLLDVLVGDVVLESRRTPWPWLETRAGAVANAVKVSLASNNRSGDPSTPRPACQPSRRHASRSKMPRQAPALRSTWFESPGTKASSESSNCSFTARLREHVHGRRPSHPTFRCSHRQ